MGDTLIEAMAHFIIQLAVVLIAAKVAGEVAEKVFRAPRVLGELTAGIIIGPFALGGVVKLPAFGYLFPVLDAGSMACMGVPCDLFALAQISSLILLFYAGLETDLAQFLKYSKHAVVIALGGMLLPFFAGAWLSMAMGYGASPFDAVPLFVGTIMTATSVGITVRILTVMGKLDTPDGVTILGAAVADDIGGIFVLAIVLSFAGPETASIGQKIAVVGVKAFFFLGLLVGFGVIISRMLPRVLTVFTSQGSVIVISLSLCFLAAAAAEYFGLAMIIGAYVTGLSLSTSDVSEKIREDLDPIYHTFVPIFFVVMGMLVDIPAVLPVLSFGLMLTAVAVAGKFLGCGLPALGLGFSLRQSLRIGIGMIPRGEVALIIAGVGLSAGMVNQDIFGVVILMTLITSIAGPFLLVKTYPRPSRAARPEPEARTLATHEWDDLLLGTKHSYSRTLPTEVTHQWLKVFTELIVDNGFDPKRSLTIAGHGISTYKSAKEGIINISVAHAVKKGLETIKLTSNSDDLETLIKQADALYNKYGRLTFIEPGREVNRL
jgi:Kef-type K+ transport system membrane component KefB